MKNKSFEELPEYPSVETCLKMYNANRGNKLCAYMVLDALVREKVVMAFDQNGSIVAVPYAGHMVIPVFTSMNEVKQEKFVQLQAVFLRDYVDVLLSLNMHLAVNPFSSADIRFAIPCDVISKLKEL